MVSSSVSIHSFPTFKPFVRFDNSVPTSSLLGHEVSLWLACQCLIHSYLMCSDRTGFCLPVDAITVNEQPPQSCVPPVDVKAATVLQLEQTVLQNSGKGKGENSPCCCGSANAAGDSKQRLLQPTQVMLQTTEV